MARCEACGSESPRGAAYCGACGHRLGQPPEEPVVVNVRVVNSFWDGCVGCFAWVVVVIVVLALIGWLFSC